VSPIELADGREVEGGAKSYDWEKAWSSKNPSILSELTQYHSFLRSAIPFIS
jgi:hypothetical protein